MPKKKLSINWSYLSAGSVVAFLAGWFLFGFSGAVILAIIVMVLMGYITMK